MGKAYRAPMDTYSPRLNITPHAVQRFRERAKTFLEREGHLSDEAVKLQLDFYVSEAMKLGEEQPGVVFDMFDEGRASKLVHIEHPEWESLWALVRENGDQRIEARWVVITLITDWMVCESTVSGRYTGELPRLPQFAKHYELMREPRKLEPKPAVVVRRPSVPELKAVTPPPVAAAALAEPIAAAQPPSGEAPATASAPPPSDERRTPVIEPRLVTYEHLGAKHSEELALSDVAARIEALLDAGVKRDAVRVWKPATVRTRVEVD